MAIDDAEIPVCDGHVNEEKLRELRAIGTERPALDYKSTADLARTKDIIEAARDIAAMSSNRKGGYLVYGLDNDGQAALNVAPIQPAHFDEATLRDKVKKYVGDQIELTTCVHEVDGRDVAVVYVHRAPCGMTPMLIDGQYQDERGVSCTRFREGDIFVRRGTQVDKMKGPDLAQLLRPEIEAEKEESRRELAQAFAHAQAGAAGAIVAQGVPGTITWQLPQSEFDAAVVQTIRSGDRVAQRAALLPLIGDAAALLRERERLDDLRTLLNRLTALMATSLTYEDRWLFERSLSTMRRVYELGAAPDGTARRDLGIPARQLWLAIGVRVEALGGLAIRLEAWTAVRELVLTPASNGYFASWLRAAVTEAANGGLLPMRNGRIVPGSFAGLARETAADVASLRPDVRDTTLPPYTTADAPAEEDHILDSILQFDAAWCAIALAAKPSGGGSQFNPSFATFYPHRVAPLLDLIATDQTARSALFASQADRVIAAALRAVLEAAHQEAVRHGHYSSYFVTQTLHEFLSAASTEDDDGASSGADR